MHMHKVRANSSRGAFDSPSLLSVHSLQEIAGSLPIIPGIWARSITPVNRPRLPDRRRDLAKAKVSVVFGTFMSARRKGHPVDIEVGQQQRVATIPL
jgi:hypothetical protein